MKAPAKRSPARKQQPPARSKAQVRSAAEVCLVLVTVPDEQVGVALARALVDLQLAACVNLLPGVRSIYRWKGAICDDREALLLVKTRAARFEALRAAIVARHPSEVPEVVRLDVGAGHTPYLDWVRDNVPVA